jgi:hypothetical protein
MKPWPIQIQQLIELGEYEEALGLMDGLDETHLPNKVIHFFPIPLRLNIRRRRRQQQQQQQQQQPLIFSFHPAGHAIEKTECVMRGDRFLKVQVRPGDRYVHQSIDQPGEGGSAISAGDFGHVCEEAGGMGAAVWRATRRELP